MFIIGYFLQALASVLHVLFMMATIIIIARAVLSWVSPDPNNQIVLHYLSVFRTTAVSCQKAGAVYGGYRLVADSGAACRDVSG